MKDAIRKELESLSKTISQEQAKELTLTKLSQLYPDLNKFTGRWKKEVFYSAEVNKIAVEFDMRHNCGCCNDSPLEVWPYYKTEYGNVYSDPPKFIVGEAHWISGDIPRDGWKDVMRAANICESIIQAVSAHFKKCYDERVELASANEPEDES